MTTYCLVNAFQEADNLPIAWDSVQKVIPDSVLVVVDGKYPDFPGALDVSSDGTRDYARSHGFLVDSIDYECAKRTAGLRFIDEHAVDGDYVLYLDADETLRTLPALPERVGILSFTRDSDGQTYNRARLYRWEPGLEFKGRHYDLYRNGSLYASLDTAPESRMVGTGTHRDTSHSAERQADKTRYYSGLTEREAVSA